MTYRVTEKFCTEGHYFAYDDEGGGHPVHVKHFSHQGSNWQFWCDQCHGREECPHILALKAYLAEKE